MPDVCKVTNVQKTYTKCLILYKEVSGRRPSPSTYTPHTPSLKRLFDEQEVNVREPFRCHKKSFF